jgi:transglutaminase-like putative cysteine protease
VVDFSPDAYPGFGDAMDLRARGQLSDDIVFRVRADQPALWRAQAFDDFDGTTWTVSDPAWVPLELSPDAGSFRVDPARGDLPGLRRNTIVQTFYLDGQQPNVLFAAARPVTVYFPSGGLQDNEQGTIRAPILLDPGIVYSVESSLPIDDPAALRMMPRADRSDPLIGPFLQLPDELPHRDRALARRITSGAATQHDAVQDVQEWLRTNTRYDLTVPREPDGVDAVDWFLFRTRRGFCEHIASAMIVLLRAAGIPARIVTGYAPGDRNPFTGYFEVRQSDAHAWVEVWYPDVGWVPYDPTFGVPLADMSWGSFVGQDVLAAVARVIGDVVPPSVRRAIASSLHAVAHAVANVGSAWPLAVIAIACLGVIWAMRRRRGPRSERPPDEIGRAYEDLLDVLGRAGLPREPSATPAEVLTRAEADLATPRELVRSATVVVRTFERARYAPAHERPGADEVARARAEAARARALGSRRPAVTSRDVPEHQAPS